MNVPKSPAHRLGEILPIEVLMESLFDFLAQRRAMTAIEVCRTAVLGGHRSVTTAPISATLITPVAIDTAQNASRLPGSNGSRTARPNS